MPAAEDRSSHEQVALDRPLHGLIVEDEAAKVPFVVVVLASPHIYHCKSDRTS